MFKVCLRCARLGCINIFQETNFTKKSCTGGRNFKCVVHKKKSAKLFVVQLKISDEKYQKKKTFSSKIHT